MYNSQGQCPLNRFVPRPSFLTIVVGQSQPSVGQEGPNRVHWPVSKMPVSTKPLFLRYDSLPFDVREEKLLSGHRSSYTYLFARAIGMSSIQGVCRHARSQGEGSGWESDATPPATGIHLFKR